MKRCFIFCHGFGFDKNFWHNLAPYFLEEECAYLDLGYFEDKIEFDLENHNISFIGIGHSLGLSKLLNLNNKFDSLIGLNGFVNFIGNDYLGRKKRQQELQILKDHLMLSPLNTLKNFYNRCGVPVEIQKIKKIKKDVLLNDLKSLLHVSHVPDKTPMLIIGAKDDVIVPSKILYDNFDKYSNVKIEIIEQGKHGLGFLESDTIYRKIIGFLSDTH